MGFINTKEKIICPECGHQNEILTLESYGSQSISVGTVSGGGTKLKKHTIPMRVVTSGKCSDCGKNYQIIPKELVFLRRFNLPIPDHCPLCRDRARIKQMNPIQIYKRKCDKCKTDMETSYSTDRPEIVYCESCYKQEVY